MYRLVKVASWTQFFSLFCEILKYIFPLISCINQIDFCTTSQKRSEDCSFAEADSTNIEQLETQKTLNAQILGPKLANSVDLGC